MRELSRANLSQDENTRSFRSGFSDGQGAKGTNHCDPEGLRRGIGQRQLGMIAIGGAIGTGLFFASGAAISQAGPGGALLAYSLMGLAVYCMMQSLGEMATQLPIPGAFEAYAERFIDPSLGFAFGWLPGRGCRSRMVGSAEACTSLILSPRPSADSAAR